MEILVNANNLDQCISQLKTLKETCDVEFTIPAGGESCGNVCSNLEQIAKLYQDIRLVISGVIANSIAFLESARTGMEQSDIAASKLVSDTGSDASLGAGANR